ncbi:Tfp pilus assembly protein PilF [Paucidesulfovibrio gracilis DSM 16080]|uniref:Tfp pilus assembly protein PilF n=1 Tax=Paucidesulfovibrio gracilis DSM 16080 TaxID=1121449 RepID=A0A1T4XX29_9BACT|nr:tetratricopeptide repeat protein [Paucidesulfovibrio gracilis]SKA93581.1 Tfp pilus assembly protein PilF [Paucidesulfovibrio gracilis DSM 16080]
MNSLAVRDSLYPHADSGRARSRVGALAALLLLLALAQLCGCAPRRQAVDPAETAPDIAPPKISQDAELTYNYLLFQDQISELERLTRTGRVLREDETRVMELQENAARVADSILEVRPSPEMFVDKASLFFNTEQIGRARRILSQGLRQFPENRPLVAALVNAYLMENNVENAVLLLEEYLLSAPEDHQMRQRLAGVLIDAQEYARGLDQLNVIPKAERNKVTLYLQARAESRLGRQRQALRTLDRALELDPYYYEAWAEMAYQRELDNDLPGAIKAYEQLLKLGGPEEEIRTRLVTLQLKLNSVDAALKTAMDGPAEKAYLLSTAGGFLNQGFPAQASAVLDTLAGFDPVPSEFYFYKAVIAFEAEQNIEKALEYLDKVPAGDDRYDDALEFRIQILHTLKRPEEVLKLLHEGQKVYPDNVGFYQMEAEYWMDREDIPQALGALERGLEQRSDNPDLLYRYGALLDESGQRHKGLEVMERIITANPRHADALNYIGYTLAQEGRDLKRAQVLVENALMEEPDNGYILDSLAWVHYKAGALSKAWEVIQRAVREVPSEPTLWEHYGDIAAALGKKVSALEGYRKAIQFGAEDVEAVKAKIKSL